ncbi:MAG TPA: hypothetical protein VN540_00285, partial [Clostridia bacterium]|nr:hypothetical protein [Clostridia bacterium]
EWLNDLSDTPSSIKLAAIYDYTIENPTFVLLEGQVFPRIDTCTLRLIDEDGETHIWRMEDGGKLVDEEGIVYEWSDLCEFGAPQE